MTTKGELKVTPRMMRRFAINLMQEREYAQVTQEELAKRVGVTQACISYIEAGEYDAKVGLCERIAAALGVGDMTRMFREVE